MKIVFKKIPRSAIIFYVIGLLLLSVSISCMLFFATLFDAVRLQQVFLLGAIIIAVGSVINTLYQFRPKK